MGEARPVRPQVDAGPRILRQKTVEQAQICQIYIHNNFSILVTVE